MIRTPPNYRASGAVMEPPLFFYWNDLGPRSTNITSHWSCRVFPEVIINGRTPQMRPVPETLNADAGNICTAMFNRFANSWKLVKYSATVLKKDRELLVFPLISSIAALLVLASFVPLFGVAPESEDSSINMVVLFGLYLAEYFVIFFFNSALVGAAMIRMDGGNPGIMDGLRIAWSKVGAIFGYALISATVGLLLRTIGQRFGFVGRIIAGLSGIAWSIASYLAVPMLVSRNIGPLDAIRESTSLLKRTWGENLIAGASIGLVFKLVFFLVFLLIAFLAGTAFSSEETTLAAGIAVLGLIVMILLGLFQAALQGVFSAALYRYAINGDDGNGLSSEVLNNAFAPKDGFITADSQRG